MSLELSGFEPPKLGRSSRYLEQLFTQLLNLLNEHPRVPISDATLLILIISSFLIEDIPFGRTRYRMLLVFRISESHVVLACDNVERLEESCRRCISRLVLHVPSGHSGRRVHVIASTDDPTSFMCTSMLASVPY